MTEFEREIYNALLKLTSEIAHLQQWQKDFESRQVLTISTVGIILAAIQIIIAQHPIR